MKLRHAVALALAGWYLMVPPGLSDRAQPFRPDATLSEWTILRSFDSAKECEEYKERKGIEGVHALVKSNAMTDAIAVDVVAGVGTCTASDDPRLRAK